MLQNAQPRPPRTQPTFDAGAWLARFNRAGGYLRRTADGRLAAGWHLTGFTPAQNRAARAAWATIEGDNVRLAAISAEVAALLEGSGQPRA